MPITVEVVSREAFDAWMEELRVAEGLDPVGPELRFADRPAPQRLAQAE
jgi:heme/copper-type cytochrome/quinol oxidase subunit 2